MLDMDKFVPAAKILRDDSHFLRGSEVNEVDVILGIEHHQCTDTSSQVMLWYGFLQILSSTTKARNLNGAPVVVSGRFA